jgi:resuscitation-promoting factor RpfA
MTSRPRTSKGRSLVRLALVGAVAAGAPLALAGTANAAPDSAWDKLAQCESGGNWSTDTGNGFSGGLQFTPGTWRSFGGSGSPQGASREEQIAVAERVLAAQGWNAWPACSRKMGLRGEATEPNKAPAARKVSSPASPSAHAAPQAKTGRSGGTYTVRRGDTLGKIAQAHGTTVKALLAANRGTVSNPHVLRAGAKLHV